MGKQLQINIIYWEGGNSYRPFLVIPANPHWVTENIAYYKSSGQSNIEDIGKNKYKKDTWFPTIGLLKKDTILYNELQKEDAELYTDGYILKRSVFAHLFGKPNSNWFRAIHTKFEFSPKFALYGMIPEFLRKNNTTEETSIPELLEKIKDAILSLSDYCQFWWQVQISAQLGGGLWEQLPEFRDFVLLHDYEDYKMSNYVFVEKTRVLEPILYTTNTINPSSSSNADEVMSYLLDNQAIFRKLLLEDYRSDVDKIKKHIFLGISSSSSPSSLIVKKKTPSPIKEKSPSPKPSPKIVDISSKRKRSLSVLSSSPSTQKRKRTKSPNSNSPRKTKKRISTSTTKTKK